VINWCRKLLLKFGLSGLLESFSWLRNLLSFKITEIERNLYLVKDKKSGFYLYFPFKNLSRVINTQLSFLRGGGGFFNHYREKYLYDGFEIPTDWDIVDCGAYVGGFSLSVSPLHHGRIFSLEPSPYNFRALVENIELHKVGRIIKPLNIGLGKCSGGTLFHISVSGQDDSSLSVDEKIDDFHETVEVHQVSFSDFAKANNLRLDKTFLKLEAEGEELSIIQGFNGSLPAVISVDVSAEFFGKSPILEVKKLLTELGYHCKTATSGPRGEPVALISYLV